MSNPKQLALIVQHHAAVRGLSARGRMQLQQVVALADLAAPADSEQILLRSVPAIVASNGNAAATVSQQLYDTLRALEVDGDEFRAMLGENKDPEHVRTSVRNALTKHGGNPVAAERILAATVDRHVKQSARNTLIANGLIDPARPRFARVPRGPKTCTFCLMLASRGFVYLTAESAGEMQRWHSYCDCAVVPSWRPDPVMTGYDPDALYRQWREQESEQAARRATRAAGAGSP